MNSGFLLSSPNNASSSLTTTGGNLSRSKHYSTHNIYFASSYAAKASQNRSKTKIKYTAMQLQHPSLNHHNKWIEGESTYQECKKKYVVQAVSESAFDSEPHASDPKMTYLDSVKDLLAIIYKFSYPYAMIGIILCAVSSSLLTVEKLSDISPSFIVGVLQAAIPHVMIAIYSNSINQVFDLQIDRINKPHLPLASGQLSTKTVAIIAASFLIMSFGLSWSIGSWPLIWNVICTFSIWTAYSMNAPLLRWKKNPLLAAFCMVSSWGFVLPITFYLHMQTFVLKRPSVFPTSLIFVVAFMSLYSLGMALAKDIPDVEGDKLCGVDTFSIRWGPKQVFWICVLLFEMAFGIALLGGATSPNPWVKLITLVGNTALASVLWYQAKSTDLSNPASGQSFYMLNWKLLYAGYILIGLIR